MSEDVIDLTELIETGENKGKNKSERPEYESGGEEFSQALSPATGRPVDANERLDMSDLGGIDNLLESLDIPSQPVRGSSAEPSGDLDSALDELLGEPQGKKEDSKADPAGDFPDLDADLDAILGDIGDGESASSGGKSANSEPDLPGDLDDFLSDTDSPKSGKSGEPAGQRTSDFEDDLLGELDDFSNKAESLEAEMSVGLEELSDGKKANILGKNANTASEKSDEFSAELPADLDDLLNEPMSGQVEKTVSASEPADEFSMDFLGEGVSAKSEKDKEARDVTGDLSLATGQKAGVEKSGFTSENGEKNAANLQVLVSSQAELIGEICKAIAAQEKEFLGEFSAELWAERERNEKFERRIEKLEERLSAYEKELRDTRDSLERTSSASLNDLLNKDSPIHAELTALISGIVNQAISAFSSKLDSNYELIENFKTLERSVKSFNASMESVEKRLDNLEPRFNKEIEKAASAAVARLLNEEIGKLLLEK